jgi:hypothetical protein
VAPARASVGFLVGPAVVGLAADALSLRAALGGVAGLAVVLAGAAALAPAASPRTASPAATPS